MRLRFVPEAAGIIEASPFVVHEPEAMRGRWHTGSRPLYIEIGMGKGRFLIETAALHPDADYVGIERYGSVLFRACERMEGIPYKTPADKLERLEHPEREEAFVPPQNLRFLNIDARALPACFAEEEIDGIYLNFSDPWPKARHARRRLTSGNFLSLYEKVLKKGGQLEFKTDNQALFAFSTEEIRQKDGWELKAVTFDLHRDPVLGQGNVMTEYERRFSNLGNRICKLIAVWNPAS